MGFRKMGRFVTVMPITFNSIFVVFFTTNASEKTFISVFTRESVYLDNLNMCFSPHSIETFVMLSFNLCKNSMKKKHGRKETDAEPK